MVVRFSKKLFQYDILMKDTAGNAIFKKCNDAN